MELPLEMLLIPLWYGQSKLIISRSSCMMDYVYGCKYFACVEGRPIDMKHQEHPESPNSAKAKCHPKMIRDPDFGLIHDPDGTAKCHGFITLSASISSPSFVKKSRRVTVWDMLRNFLKSRIAQWWIKLKKMIQNPHADAGKHQKLTTNRGSPLVLKYLVDVG